MPKAVYPGSVDPITYGHIGAIRDTANVFGKVIVAIGINPAKNYLFSLSEREDLARKGTAGIPGVSVTSFSGLLVHFLVRNDFNVVVRGVRNGQDLDDALLQETIGWQQTLAKDIKALYVPATPGQAFTSSTALKAVLKEQGDATHMAPLSTIHATQARMQSQYFYGVTGVSGSGKSSVCRKFADIAAKRNIPLIHVDMDKIAHGILSTEQEPLYKKIRQKIKRAFGPDILDQDGFIVRKKLGNIVFGNPDKLKILNEIIHDSVFFRMNDILRGKKGVFLIDTALLAETNRMSMVNNQIMVVEADEKELAKRLQQRDGLTPEQVERRLSSSFNTAAKLSMIEADIKEKSYGHLQRVNNAGGLTDAAAEKAFDTMLAHTDIYGELRITGFLKNIGVTAPQDAYTAIRKFYAGNDRFHHTLARVVDGIDRMPDMAASIHDKDAFMLAWLFQSAVYDTQKNDNALKSAELLEKTCTAWAVDSGLIARAKTLVTSVKIDEASSNDAKLMADMSIAVLGASAADYRRYEENSRREYPWMTSADWAQQQKAFLQSLPTPCFHSDYFRKTLGNKAAKNIERALKPKSVLKNKPAA